MASDGEFPNDNDLIFGDDLLDGGVGNDTLAGQGGVLVSFYLEDVTSPIDGGIVADISVSLDYSDDIDSSDLKDVVPIGNYIEDFLANYPVEAGLYEVLNRDLTEALLNDSELGLSEDLDSIAVNLDVEPKIIPFQFDSTFTQTDSGAINDVISFELANVTSSIYGGIVADVSVELDFADGIDPSSFRDVIPIGDFIEDFLGDYSVNSLVFYEGVNRDLTEALLNDSELGLSEVLDSISVNLDVAPNLIPFEYDSTTTTQTESGEINDVVTFELEDIASAIDGANVADVSVELDYVDGIDPSSFRDVVPISEFIKDFIANYSVEANNYIGEFLSNFVVEPGFYEVLNRDLTEALLNNSELGLSGVLDSISVNLDVEPKIIPFEYDSTTTQTDSGEINDVVSFQLEDVTSTIDDASVSDISVELDYINGIDPSGFKDVIPLGDFVEDYLTNYSNPNDSIEVVNNNLGNALLTDSNLGLSEVLDSLTITFAPSPGVIPFPSESTVTLTPDETTIFTEDLDFTDAIASSQGLQIEGSDGNDRINGTDGNDIINSGNGDDTINSGAGDDTINGGRGNDILEGGAGTDVLALFDLNRGDENIGFVGEANNFTFFVDGADEGTFLNIESVKFDNGEVVSTEDLDFTDAIASSQGLQIEGSDGNDRINGTDGNDIINSNKGDDTLNGGKGDDTLNGGAGTDVLAFDLEPSENITYVGSANDFNVLVDSINEGTFTNIESIEFANGDVIAAQDLDFA